MRPKIILERFMTELERGLKAAKRQSKKWTRKDNEGFLKNGIRPFVNDLLTMDIKQQRELVRGILSAAPQIQATIVELLIEEIIGRCADSRDRARVILAQFGKPAVFVLLCRLSRFRSVHASIAILKTFAGLFPELDDSSLADLHAALDYLSQQKRHAEIVAAAARVREALETYLMHHWRIEAIEIIADRRYGDAFDDDDEQADPDYDDAIEGTWSHVSSVGPMESFNEEPAK